ncbi:MAG: 50S ribosomal protein L31e [Nanoarchaeota archaeon]|nr:50S ribosomal protein L31e [Nanoarchaeota archaeon]
MAENQNLTREYVIPLRRVWIRAPEYKRSGKAVKAIKQFIAKHMKVADRDLDKVKLDVYFNNEVWFKGRTNPPAKVKVRAVKEGGIVRVTFAETPKYVEFLKKKHEKFRKKEEKKEVPAQSKESERKEEPKTEEQKKDEAEKEKSVEQQNIQQAEQQAKAEKHLTKVKEPKIQRMALKK